MTPQRDADELPPPPTDQSTKESAFNPRITYRLNVTSLEDSIDAMLHRATGKIDLSNPDHKARFKSWLLQFCEHLVSNMQSDFSKAATIGMEQMAKLIRDPKHRENVREKRMKYYDHGKPDLVKKVRETRRKKAAEERLQKEYADK